MITYTYFQSMLSGPYLLEYLGNYEQNSYNEFLEFEEIRNELLEGVFIKVSKVNTFIKQQKDSRVYSVESHIKKGPQFDPGIDVILNTGNPKLKNANQKFFVDSN